MMIVRAVMIAAIGVIVGFQAGWWGAQVDHVHRHMHEGDWHGHGRVHRGGHAHGHQAEARPVLAEREQFAVVDIDRAVVERLVKAEMPEELALLPHRRGEMIEGAVVIGAQADSLFTMLGLRTGDIIMAVNDRPVLRFSAPLEVMSAAELRAELLSPGKVVDLSLMREGQPLRVIVLLH